MTVDRKSAYDADDMKVLTDGDRLTAIGKTIPAFDAETDPGSCGSPRRGGLAFVKTVEAILKTPEGLKRWYLSVINELAQQGQDVKVAHRGPGLGRWTSRPTSSATWNWRKAGRGLASRF